MWSSPSGGSAARPVSRSAVRTTVWTHPIRIRVVEHGRSVTNVPSIGAELCGVAGEPTGRLALWRDPDDVPGKADALKPEDDPGRRVRLVPAQSMARAARERVVIVMPGLAEGEDRQDGDVRRVVFDVEAPGAEEVAHGVHRPRHVVNEK